MLEIGAITVLGKLALMVRCTAQNTVLAFIIMLCICNFAYLSMDESADSSMALMGKIIAIDGSNIPCSKDLHLMTTIAIPVKLGSTKKVFVQTLLLDYTSILVLHSAKPRNWDSI